MPLSLMAVCPYVFLSELFENCSWFSFIAPAFSTVYNVQYMLIKYWLSWGNLFIQGPAVFPYWKSNCILLSDFLKAQLCSYSS